MTRTIRTLVLLGMGLLPFFGSGQTNDTVVVFNDASSLLRIDRHVFVYQDSTNQRHLGQVAEFPFEEQDRGTPNLGITNVTVWVKLHLLNATEDSLLYITVRQPSIDQICLYQADTLGYGESCLGEIKPYHERFVDNPAYTFPITLKKGEIQTYYFRILSKDQIQLPILLGTSTTVFEVYSKDNLLFGMYAGIILVMMLYNLFVALTVRDAVYIYYIIYIFFVGLTQAFFQGYAFKFLWPHSTWLASNGSVIIPFLSGISTILFIKPFLQIRRFLPRHIWGLHVLILLYIVSLALGLAGHYHVSILLLQLTASGGSVYVIGLAFVIRQKGYRPALFFLVAFSIFLSSVIVFALRNFNMIPFNGFTSYILEIGSVIQIVLLSFALADKINTYRKEKEDSQLEAIAIAKENEKLVREQNIVLEHRVGERTHALKESNESLQRTLAHLKETQSQLVEAEKMASLGQLTAGVAHEINNPINFVTSNVAPLKRDVNMVWDAIAEIERIALVDNMPVGEKERLIQAYKEDIDVSYLKTEIDFLLKGMHEGATRTAEIVKSLRIFSRVDEESLKFADINEGLDSTLVILNSVIKEGVTVVKKLGDLPPIECYPGKLNQVFLNIITNGLYAINKKFNGKPGGILEIETTADSENAHISIRDNGIGMSDEVKGKIFEPFFTTKEVGEGTGLGMSIVYNTIKKHHGEINVETSVGEGVRFLITIPLVQQVQVE
ncbi:7TM diverse intracellular signaling domain-containing protein [Parapedobacter sp. 2B3]|uniref:sensor histidine kinase n=1 Tax=Parapedobacter sp. 2B3 TaxID=3342381 RepID=UPI0035B57772